MSTVVAVASKDRVFFFVFLFFCFFFIGLGVVIGPKYQSSLAALFPYRSKEACAGLRHYSETIDK